MEIIRPCRWLASVAACLFASLAVAQVELAPCDSERFGERSECGRLEVLEDRGRPDGRTIELELVVMRAEGATTREPLFMFAGGPGQAATDLADLALRPFVSVRATRDVVLVDQRGTGGSNRIDCLTDPIADPQVAFGGLFDPEHIRGCAERGAEHAALDRYTTRQVVADIDEVRSRLGYDKILMWGGSGGTRTALVYMREYPEHVAGALLDGVTPTDFRAPSGYARSAQDSLDRVFADCAAQAACAAAYPDLKGSFRKLLALFDGGPVAATITDREGIERPVTVHRGDFGYAVRGILYSARNLVRLPAMIHSAAADGDVSAFAQTHWERDVVLRPVVAMGVHLGIFCAEDVPFIEERRVDELTEGTFLGSSLLGQYRGACDEWARADVAKSFLEPVRSDAPVLLFSGYYDPSTPASLAAQVARHLPNSRHIVVRNESHGAEFGCGRQAAIDFLVRGTLDGLPEVCEGIGPVIFETS